MKHNTLKTLKIYWQHCLDYKLVGLTMFVSIILASVFDVIVPLYSKDFINLISQSSANPQTALIPAIIKLLLVIAGVQAGRWLFSRIFDLSNIYFETRIMADISNQCFEYLHKNSFSFFLDNFAGALVKKVKWFVSTFEVICDNLMQNIVPLLVNIILSYYILARLNLYLGLGLLAWIIIFMSVNIFLARFKMKYDLLRSEAETNNTGLLSDTIANSNTVKLFNGYDRETKLFAESTEVLRCRRKQTWLFAAFFDGMQAFLTIVLQFGINYYAVLLWQRGRLTIGDFFLIQALLIGLIMTIWNFGRVIRKTYEALSDAEEMTVILNTPHEIQDIPKAAELSVPQGKIEFKDVCFNYNETREILKKLNLTIEPRERVAFIGSSGAGKTTITRLLLRTYDLTAGSILIDGQNIARVTQESLWQNVSLVPQEPILFHRTLMDNIRYGRPDVTEEEVIMAAKAAHCHEFISAFPDGYETFVGERGVKLSGGERQRVAIARAILRNVPIIVLDEATSSLDSESERLIQEALAELMKNKTVIVIAHRLSTIRQMNRIIVIDNGEILEEGSHQDLLAKEEGMYSKLWQLQAGGFIQ